MGMDSNNTENISRTDTIILASVKKDKILLMPIPRDLLLNIKGKDRRINSIYELYGKEELLKTVSNLTNLKIDNYIIFNYSIFKDIGDILSPVSIYVEKDMIYDDFHQNLHIELKKGKNDLDGTKLLYYVRFRHDDFGDIGRIQRQKKALYALMNSIKKQGFQTLLKTLNTVLKNTINTFSFPDILKLYSSSKSANIEFIEFPYKLKDNYAVVDNSQLLKTQYYLKNFKKQENKLQKWIIFTKSYTNYNYSFYSFVFSKFNKSGYKIKTIDNKVDFFNNTKNYVFIKNIKVKDEILNDLKNSFNKDFIILNDKKKYFETINFLVKNHIDTINYDAVVILGE
ncbi:hypothetical protein OSSY52_17840 [Tepiditoga spiralis]|uniref:Cell envelope-related transcriptional attenuator domain-containing protein n=2 Tax=Tepiditoga spiralis TaxID=2108365 RepID=A0A7G1G9K3_9BACT|nr:hypothetical protein OSSY52_17840 [Tepiditoga spiralis]